MSVIGLWSDNHNFPSLPLMKLSAFLKQKHTVEHYVPLKHYDAVYASKTFSFTADIKDTNVVLADELIKGGTGYCIKVIDSKEVFNKNKDIPLHKNIEHIYPDYSLYSEYKHATGFLTRGCPRNCGFCIVSDKEGCRSTQVADISEFWRGQKDVKLLDPNILACKDHENLLIQLAETSAKIDFTQGLDIRLINSDNIKLLNNVKTHMMHFAWDNPKQDLTEQFKLFAENTIVKSDRNRVVYVLTNFNSTFDEDLYRIYTLRDLGYSPYVMIYQKETAPKQIKQLQRWCNNRFIFRSTNKFEEYESSKGKV